MSFCASSRWRISSASFTCTRRRFVFCGKRCPKLSFMLMPISSSPEFEKMSIIGIFVSFVSTSTSFSSRCPSRRSRLSFSRVPLAVPSSPFSSKPGFRDGRRMSSTRSSASSRARACTRSSSSSSTSFSDTSTRSRIIDSQSRPT